MDTLWRRLTAIRQAAPLIAHLRKGELYAGLATGFNIGTTVVFRHFQETLGVLVARPVAA